MSLATFLKIVNKAFKFTISRPLQRFNIENRAVKYLGPESKKFIPSPRAIGRISGLPLKELPRYPHLDSSFKSIGQKRRDAIESGESEDHVPRPIKSYSEEKVDDDLVIEASNKLDVVKTVARIEPPQISRQIEPDHREETPKDDTQLKPSHRPLPTSRDLPLQDLNSIWEVRGAPPPGRLDLNMLQELMINKLADNVYWTPKAIADRYNIREEYAEKLIGCMKQIRIRVSPRLAKNMDLVGLNNPQYKAAKHLIYFVDKSMRSNKDRQFDSMFSLQDQLPDDVREVIEPPSSLQLESEKRLATGPKQEFARPKPLRIVPMNASKQQQADSSRAPPSLIGQDVEGVKKLEAPKGPRFGSND